MIMPFRNSQYPASWSSLGLQQLFHVHTNTSGNPAHVSPRPFLPLGATHGSNSTSTLGLSEGQVAGITVGGLALLVILSVGCRYLLDRRRKTRAAMKSPHAESQSRPPADDSETGFRLRVRERVVHESGMISHHWVERHGGDRQQEPHGEDHQQEPHGEHRQ